MVEEAERLTPIKISEPQEINEEILDKIESFYNKQNSYKDTVEKGSSQHLD